ncbi:hypothetical protein, partial [Acetobacter malorum]|uniref:hypothetical protein n=1 Tax=Acetobacter malorum TaxID=178901 RepID=UPI0022314581
MAEKGAEGQGVLRVRLPPQVCSRTMDAYCLPQATDTAVWQAQQERSPARGVRVFAAPLRRRGDILHRRMMAL